MRILSHLVFRMSGGKTINGTKELFVDVICRTTISRSELRREIPWFQPSWVSLSLSLSFHYLRQSCDNISVKRKQLAHGEAIDMLAALVGIDTVKKLCFISSCLSLSNRCGGSRISSENFSVARSVTHSHNGSCATLCFVLTTF